MSMHMTPATRWVRPATVGLIGPGAARRRARLATLALLLLLPAAAYAQVTTRNMTLHAHLDEYHVPVNLLPYAYSACWSYVHSDGREYAVIGTSGGTAIYNVTNPAAAYRTGFIAGPPSIWREMK